MSPIGPMGHIGRACSLFSKKQKEPQNYCFFFIYATFCRVFLQKSVFLLQKAPFLALFANETCFLHRHLMIVFSAHPYPTYPQPVRAVLAQKMP